MRLLQHENTSGHRFSLTKGDPQNIPYAILSHRWGIDEVDFRDVEDGTSETKAGGYRKLEFCTEQAAQDGLQYCWVDTCCIDKSNNTELSEAINSMFKWYQMAKKCYVYLPDVSAEGDWESTFQQSEWFRRGWTLQELLAPAIVEFFSKEGTKLGDKRSLERQIHQATGISIEALRGRPLSEIDLQERLAWTVRRETTVDEDAVYCLLGIFGVYMSLIYGEGRQNALARLQRKIQRSAKSNAFVATNAPWIVPFERNSRFTGRESLLADLQGKLFVKNQSQTSKIAIVGLGGVGKTQLVLELLHITKEQHPDCSIIWIPSTTNETLQQGYLAVAQQLNIPGYEDEKVDVKGLVQDHLSRDDAGQWLLVFDNADDIEMWKANPSTQGPDKPGTTAPGPSSRFRRLIDYLPRNRRGCIIFTTRDRKAAVQLAQQNIVTVPEMSEQTAAQLLEKSLVSPDLDQDSQEVSKLLAALTYLPLAITQAAAYINTNGISVADYISLLGQTEDEAIEILSEDFEDYGRYQETKNPIATTWLISFEQIRRSDPLAAEYLSFIACISPRDIPQSLLPPGPSRKKEIDAIGTLTAYSFVTRRSTSASLDLHRLVYLTTRNWLRKEELLSQWTETSITRLEGVFPTGDHNNRATWRLYLPHAQQVLASTVADDEGRQRVALMRRCGKCLLEDGRWNEAEAFINEVVATETKTLGAENPDTLMTKTYLYTIYFYQERLDEAEPLVLQVMEARKSKLGMDHTETLESMSNMALIHLGRGRLEEAEQLDLHVIEMRKTKLGVDHVNTLESMNNLALIYLDQDRLGEAENLYRQITEISKTKLGMDHPNTLRNICNMAYTYLKQGRLEEAEKLQIQVMEMSKTKLGVSHPDTLQYVSHLAMTYSAQGRWEEAEQLEAQVMESSKMQLGMDHPITLTCISNLAVTYINQGREEEALPLMVQVMETQRTRLGADNPATLLSMHILACTRRSLERYHAEGMVLMEDCVQRKARVLGLTHPDYLVSSEKLDEWKAADTEVDIEIGTKAAMQEDVN